jgi:hypothetical protein
MSKYTEDQEVRAKIDKELAAMASLEATLGLDSTVSEFKAVKKKHKEHLKVIKDLDKEFYDSITPD